MAEAIKLGLIPKNLQGDYRRDITRAEFCALVIGPHEMLIGEEVTERESFDDTNDINVLKLAGVGIVHGDGHGKFDPDGIFTREMALTLMYKMMVQIGYELEDAEPDFADAAQISSWARQAVGALQKAGVVQGDGTSFNPKQTFTREMAIMTIMNFFATLKENG